MLNWVEYGKSFITSGPGIYFLPAQFPGYNNQPMRRLFIRKMTSQVSFQNFKQLASLDLFANGLPITWLTEGKGLFCLVQTVPGQPLNNALGPPLLLLYINGTVENT